ncbi:MAG: NYN domain-containing protein [Promethearchaeota archaeon]|nr:MAG: NYN domain-containing protein [Candidatus Lokiarchaeota archaeon]
MCESNMNPYCYNLTNQSWQGNQPRFIVYEDLEVDTEPKVMIKANIPKIEEGKKEMLNPMSKKILEIPEPPEIFRKIEEIPLLTMNNEQFTHFLELHQKKVIILVDVPNFVRTLREVFPRNFEDVLRKAHQLLLEYIENSFHTSSDYIIRYFSKPAKDLDVLNKIIIKLCTQNEDKEYFHLLKIPKGSKYSDIDNYLIANGVEILERCEIRGFIIVSSDKDYLPVMRIASYKNVKARILGINTPEIYEQYNIADIKFLGIMKFFEK